ncbi:MAG: SH3 domain-containing protein [Anaerolineae bacterium]|nr:SH3 domain-containing protein [Anaerolineae bacterium]
MLQVLRLLSLVVLWALLVGAAQAQDVPFDALIMQIGDELVRWAPDGGETFIATLPPGYYSLNVSSSRKYAIYETLSQRVQAECGNGGCAGPSKFPTEFYLIDLDAPSIAPLAGAVAGGAENGRSSPVWSPDGARIAWTEGYDAADLMIYDVTSGTTTTLASGVSTYMGTGVSAVVAIEAWVDAGIVFRLSRETASGIVGDGYAVYDPTSGALLRTIPALLKIALAEGIVRFQGGDYVVTDMQLINLATGEAVTTPGGTLYAVSRTAPEMSLRVAPGKLSDQGLWSYDVFTADGVLTYTIIDQFYYVSPSGTAFLEVANDLSRYTLRVPGRDPQVLDLPRLPERLFWENLTYLFELDDIAFIAGGRCEGSVLPFRLMVALSGLVLGDTPNNIRSQPNTAAERIGQIPAGERFTVLDGPVCAETVAWWYVSHNGIEGWTAEGAGGEYWLSPESGAG